VLEIATSSSHYQDLANLAQVVLAGAAVLALIGALVQIRVTRAIAKRQLAYEYLHRFNSLEILKLREELREFWKQAEWDTFKALTHQERGRLLIVPNLIEELGGIYNRRRLDRDVAALALGVMVEVVWNECQGLIKGCRADRGEWIYREWDDMRTDTRARRERAHNKIRRRRARKTLLSGKGS
jgi:hypothetical protein